MNTQPLKITRRQALVRFAALSATLSSGWSMTGCVDVTPVATPDAALAALEEVQGYGTDPNLIFPTVPWPNVLTSTQLRTLDQFAEFLCPGSSQAGVADVLNEWLSAPYPVQSADRTLLVPGLDWLQNQDDGLNLFKPLMEQVDSGEGSFDPEWVAFADRMRVLVAGAYFSSPEGVQELGYQGNQPLVGDYPGPDQSAEVHLEQLLVSLGLSAKSPG